MQNFEYYAPTHIVFGKGAEEETGRLVCGQNCKKFCCTMGVAVL